MIEIDNTKTIKEVSPDVMAAIQSQLKIAKVYILSRKQMESFINNVFGINFYLPKQQTLAGENYERFVKLNAQPPSDYVAFESNLKFAVQTNGKINGALELFLKHMCIKNILPEGSYIIE